MSGEKLGDENGMVTLVVVIDVELLKKIDMAMAIKEKKKEEEKKKGDVSKEELCSMKGGILSIFIFIEIAPHSTPKRKLLEPVLKSGSIIFNPKLSPKTK